MTELECTIPGQSEPKGSVRAFVVNGRAILTSDNKRLAEWSSHAIRCIASRMADEGRESPLQGPLGLEVRDYRLCPKSRPKRRQRWPDVQPDLDKILRSCGDILKRGGAIRDDAQICVIEASKEYAPQARVYLRVFQLEE